MPHYHFFNSNRMYHIPMGYPLRTGQAALWLACTLATHSPSATALQKLPEQAAWRALGPCHPGTLGAGYTSQADDPACFLSENGNTSPRAELEAAPHAIQQPGEGNDHARCPLPVRDAWLRE